MGCYTVEPVASSLQERFDQADCESEELELIHNENRANARLIAAAPDLLCALKEASRALTELDPLGNQHDALMVDNAIAKAEGKEPRP